MKSAFSILFLILSFGSLTQKNTAPKLVVGIVIDQMCYDYLYRFYDRYGNDGFKKLMSKGTNCRNMHYNYVPTYTGPGHASIYTGTTPDNHGIVANDWLDRNTGKLLNCVSDTMVNSVGTSNSSGKFSPKNLISNTFTDELKLANPNSKVIAISIKDRGAILPGGHLSDGSYWYDSKSGQMVTSTFYKNELPQWVADFNAKKYPVSYMSQTWNTLYPIESYQHPDNTDYEAILSTKTAPVFPYKLAEISGEKPNLSLFTATPFANTYLTDLAIEALKAENLGKDGNSDVLSVSYSTPDILGHAFGPYSVEVEDMYLRLDMEIARLIKELEKTVGKDNFILFLTADHAAVPVPKYLTDRNLPGGYVYLTEKTDKLKADVATQFGAELILGEENNNIYLNNDLIREKGINKEELELYIAGEIKNWDGVKSVYTSNELSNPFPMYDWNQMVKLGYMNFRSGDIIFILQPGYLPKGTHSETSHRGTSHGSSFNYDTHVPLLWYGKGIKAGEIFEKLDITDIAATLTHFLNLQNTNAMTGKPILPLLKKK